MDYFQWPTEKHSGEWAPWITVIAMVILNIWPQSVKFLRQDGINNTLKQFVYWLPKVMQSKQYLKKLPKSAVTMQNSQVGLFVTSQEETPKHVFLHLLPVAYFVSTSNCLDCILL